MKKKVIIFDMDGVLFNTTKVVNEFFLNAYPTSTEKDWNEALMGNFHEELEKIKLRHKHREETPEEEKTRKERYVQQKVASPLYAGIKELILDLHNSNYILTINTSALTANCLPLLERSEVIDLFDFVATAEFSKSKVDKFKMIEDKYKVEKQDMLFITDTLGDIREANIANIPTIAVTWGSHDKSYFKREPHDNLVAITDSVDELRDLIIGS